MQTSFIKTAGIALTALFTSGALGQTCPNKNDTPHTYTEQAETYEPSCNSPSYYEP